MRRCFYISVLGLAMVSAGVSGAQEKRLVLVAGGGDGPDGAAAIKAKLQTPFGVAFDRSETLFFVELTGHRLRKVDRKGILTTIAGTGQEGDSGDGGAAAAA